MSPSLASLQLGWAISFSHTIELPTWPSTPVLDERGRGEGKANHSQGG
jgi:hypothetical protein